MGQRNRKRNYLTGIVLFIFAFFIVFFGVQFITKTGLFKIPGVVYYGEELNEAELTLLQSIFTEEVELDKDVAISANDYLELPELNENDFLFSVLVPVTDYYSAETYVAASSPSELLLKAAAEDSSIKLINVDELNFKQKLLSINDDYYLNSFNSGAIFRIITFESEKFDEEIRPLIKQAFTKTYPTKDTTLSFAQTGVTALSRGMNAKLYEVGDANYFAAEIKDYLSSFDLTHTSNESSFSDYAGPNNICSDRRFIDTLTAIGLDIVELTGNHNQDCGDDAAIESVDIYNEKGIKVVGGGKTAKEAKTPLNINQKGNNIAFLAYNLSTGGATLDDTPGANQYDEENAVEEITDAKSRGDFVIVDIQYYECSTYVAFEEDTTCDYANSSAGDQIGFFRHLIDIGADIVVGTSAHQPQTFELYGNGAIYYGLGNLFFDQYWWPGTTRSLVLEHYFYNGKLLQTKIVPTVYDGTMQTRVLDKESSTWFLQRLISERP